MKTEYFLLKLYENGLYSNTSITFYELIRNILETKILLMTYLLYWSYVSIFSFLKTWILIFLVFLFQIGQIRSIYSSKWSRYIVGNKNWWNTFSPDQFAETRFLSYCISWILRTDISELSCFSNRKT